MAFTFDGDNKLIIMTAGTTLINAVDLYSRWKDWVQLDDNSKYLIAFTTVAGDPIGPGKSIAPYIFVNTTDGWRLRAQEAHHELRIDGNLYSIDPTLQMFVPTLGNFSVTVVVERSSAAITTAGAGVDQATVQSAMNAQGFTTARAEMIENILDATIVSVGVVVSGSTSTVIRTTMSSSLNSVHNGQALQLIALSGTSIRKIDTFEQLSGTFRLASPLLAAPSPGDVVQVMTSRLALEDPRLNVLPLLLG